MSTNSIGAEPLSAALEVDSYSWTQELGKKLQYISVQIAEPFWRSSEIILESFCTHILPGEYGQCENVIIEIFKRVILTALCIVGLPITLLLSTLGMGMQALANHLVGETFTHLRGDAPEKLDQTERDTFFTLNACMMHGCLPIPFGNLPPARFRMPFLSALIRQLDPDIVVLQELGAPAAYQLYEDLKDLFAHFFINMGMEPFKMESALFCASKRPITSNPRFQLFNVEGMQNGINRGFFVIETEKARIFTTHLEPYSEPLHQNIRRQELDEIVRVMNELQKKEVKHSFLIGDLNNEREEEYRDSIISRDFIDPYLQQYPEVNADSVTYNDSVGRHYCGSEGQAVCQQLIDYALLSKSSSDSLPQPHLHVQPIETFSFDDPQRALSDHRGLLLEVIYT